MRKKYFCEYCDNFYNIYANAIHLNKNFCIVCIVLDSRKKYIKSKAPYSIFIL